MENIGKAFTYVFEDEKWLSKVLLGALFALLSVILIGIPFVAGYMLQIVRNVAEGNPKPLPEWDNLGEKFVQGLVYAIIGFIYILPGVLINACAVIASVALSPSSTSRGGELSGLGALVAVGGTCLYYIYIFIFYLLWPAVTIRFATTGNFAQAFAIGDHTRFIRENLGNYIVVLLLSIVASFIGGLGLILCIIGVFVTAFYSYLVMGYLYGQLYSASTNKLA